MENKRFRNHYSIVIERMGALITFLLIFVLTQLNDLAIELTSLDISIMPVLIGIGVFVLIFALIMTWQSWIWSKTWIVLGENSISIEKNTFTFSKNTLGIRDVSNVNVEQNIFEMLIGTSKVKINTNSFSTANVTDVKIILKKKEAEKLKQMLIERMEVLNGNEITAEKNKNENEQYSIKYSTKDIMLNSIYSINMVWVVVAIFTMAAVIVTIINLIEQILGKYNIEALMGIGFVLVILMIAILATIIFNMIKLYWKLYGFLVRREGDKICLKYGLFKQLDFSVPVDKINSIIIHQTFLARLFHKYSVEIINVGMGDDKGENTLICLYGSREKVMKSMEILLPEFSEGVDAKIEKQPKSVWIVYCIKMFVILLILSAIGIVLVWLEAPLVVPVCGISVIMLLSLVSYILTFVTAGVSISDEYIGIKEGAFAVRQSITKIEKVQYFTIYKNIFSNRLGIVKGRINILAMTIKSSRMLPYISKEKVECICEKIIKEN